MKNNFLIVETLHFHRRRENAALRMRQGGEERNRIEYSSYHTGCGFAPCAAPWPRGLHCQRPPMSLANLRVQRARVVRERGGEHAQPTASTSPSSRTQSLLEVTLLQGILSLYGGPALMRTASRSPGRCLRPF